MAKVLLIDDDRGIAVAVERLLKRAGHEVVRYPWTTSCPPGPERIYEFLAGHAPFDVIICDYELGTEFTGLDVLAGVDFDRKILYTGQPALAEQDRQERQDSRLDSVKILPKDTNLTEYLAITFGLR
jgi:CheY-like chemotaxis protein